MPCPSTSIGASRPVTSSPTLPGVRCPVPQSRTTRSTRLSGSRCWLRPPSTPGMPGDDPKARHAALHDRVRSTGPQAVLDRAFKYWCEWLRSDEERASFELDLAVLPPELRSMYRRSLLQIVAQQASSGAILAGTDSDVRLTHPSGDVYNYCWPQTAPSALTPFPGPATSRRQRLSSASVCECRSIAGCCPTRSTPMESAGVDLAVACSPSSVRPCRRSRGRERARGVGSRQACRAQTCPHGTARRSVRNRW